MLFITHIEMVEAYFKDKSKKKFKSNKSSQYLTKIGTSSFS